MTQVNVVQSTINDGSSEVEYWIDAAMRTGAPGTPWVGSHLNPGSSGPISCLPNDSRGGLSRGLPESAVATGRRRRLRRAGVGTGRRDDLRHRPTRYQYSTGLGIGARANYRQQRVRCPGPRSGSPTPENRWGIGRGQLGYARDDSYGLQLTLDQTRNTQAGQAPEHRHRDRAREPETYSANTLGSPFMVVDPSSMVCRWT